MKKGKKANTSNIINKSNSPNTTIANTLFTPKNIRLFLIILVLLVIAYFIITATKNDKEENQVPVQSPDENSQTIPESIPVEETPQTNTDSSEEIPAPTQTKIEFCMDALEFETTGWCPKNPETGKRMLPTIACTTDAGKHGVLCK